MINLKIITFRHGLRWYSCCEIPGEEHEPYYYDNTPYMTFTAPVVLHSTAFTYNKANEKMLHKLQNYFDERKK